jgi:hypothetical protein
MVVVDNEVVVDEVVEATQQLGAFANDIPNHSRVLCYRTEVPTKLSDTSGQQCSPRHDVVTMRAVMKWMKDVDDDGRRKQLVVGNFRDFAPPPSPKVMFLHHQCLLFLLPPSFFIISSLTCTVKEKEADGK